MFHDATRNYFHIPELERRDERERVIAAAMIAQMFKDFHHAKRLIKKHKIRTEWKLSQCDHEIRETINRGKLAWEWFINPPMKRAKRKITLEDCCDVLQLDINKVREVYLRPSAWRAYCEKENRTAGKAQRTNLGYSKFTFEKAA